MADANGLINTVTAPVVKTPEQLAQEATAGIKPLGSTPPGAAPLGGLTDTLPPPIGGDAKPSPVAPVQVVTPPPASVARDITAKETVTGQLNDLLSADSKYMQSAKANANAMSNSRGLLNSSMAVGASQKAAIDSSLPIATSDANIYANSGQQAQVANDQLKNTGYQGELTQSNTKLQAEEQRKTNDQQNAAQGLLDQARISKTGEEQRKTDLANQEEQRKTQQLKIDADKALNELKIQFDTTKMTSDENKVLSDRIGTMYQEYMSRSAAIDSLPSSQASDAVKAQMKAELYDALKVGTIGIGAVMGRKIEFMGGSFGTARTPEQVEADKLTAAVNGGLSTFFAYKNGQPITPAEEALLAGKGYEKAPDGSWGDPRTQYWVDGDGWYNN